MRDGIRILAIEFDLRMLPVKAAVLALGGFEVTGAVSDGSALELCRSGNFDVVILGASIPRQRRTTLALELRRMNPDVPLVIVSDLPADTYEMASASLHNLEPPQVLLSTIESLLSAERAEMSGEARGLAGERDFSLPGMTNLAGQ